MKHNTGQIDRILRIIIAIVIFGLYASNRISGTSGTLLLMLGIILAVTAAVRFCPIYWPFKLSTCAKDEKHAA